MGATDEQRMQILKMVAEGQITAEEGARLLSALEGKREEPPEGGATELRQTPPRWFRVRVTDMTTGRNKVNVNLPLGLVRASVKMGARFAPNLHGLDTQEIFKAIQEGAQGKIVEVENEEDGERVEIFVE